MVCVEMNGTSYAILLVLLMCCAAWFKKGQPYPAVVTKGRKVQAGTCPRHLPETLRNT
jgi:hypothetical protein